METLKGRRAWSEIWALNENNFNPRRYSTQQNCHSKIIGAMKVFYDKHKLNQHMTTKPPLQKILQGILHTENESKQNHEKTSNIKPQQKKRQGIRE
jgi:hypothetical protein